MSTVTILEEDLQNLCKIVAGLQVPVSIMGGATLGAAYAPWQEVHHGAGFGWKDADAYFKSLVERAKVVA